jgi:hypothetical protein
MATQVHACSRCGTPGHNRRTCPEGAVSPSTRQVRAPRAPRRNTLGSFVTVDPRYHEVPAAEAERLLVRLRPLVRECSGQPNAMDSLLLSVYLRGMLDADLAIAREEVAAG